MKRRLGRSGLEVSALGLGGWAIGGPFWRTSDGVDRRPMGWGQVDDEESIRAIHRALDLGVTLFDTANNYGAGHSEAVLGRALAGRRQEVVIATKFGSVFDEATRTHFDEVPAGRLSIEAGEPFIREACEASLRRLGTDYIDLYQLHIGSLEPELAPGVQEVLERLAEEGKIRWYGWSTDDPERAALWADGPHFTAVQHELNALRDAPEMLALLEREELGSLNKFPLRSGLLTGKFTADSTFPEDDLRHGIDLGSGRGAARLRQIEALRELLTSGGRTMAQGALAWIWARSERSIPIPGFRNVRQVEDNAGAMALGPLTPEQRQAVDEIVAIPLEPDE